MSLDPYKFFKMDNTLNMKSKQIGTRDYADILKYKLGPVKQRLFTQLKYQEVDKNVVVHNYSNVSNYDQTAIIKYNETVKLMSEFENASRFNNDIENIVNGIPVVANMPKIMDIIIKAQVSSIIEFHQKNSKCKYQIIYSEPLKEVENQLISVENAINNFYSTLSLNNITFSDKEVYFDLLKDKEFLLQVKEAYQLIETPEKREVIDYEMIEKGMFDTKILKNWKILPSAI